MVGNLIGVGLVAALNLVGIEEVDRNLNPESYEVYRKLIDVEPDGRQKEFTIVNSARSRTTTALKFGRAITFKRPERPTTTCNRMEHHP